MAGLLLRILKRRVYKSFSFFYRVLAAVNPRTRAESDYGGGRQGVKDEEYSECAEQNSEARWCKPTLRNGYTSAEES